MIDYYWFAVFVAANGILQILLTLNVTRMRLKHKVSLGDGGNTELLTAIRTHANGVEQVPIYALLILVLTVLGSSSELLAGLVIAFTVSRFFHAYGMFNQHFTARRIGAGLTFLLHIITPAVVIFQLM